MGSEGPNDLVLCSGEWALPSKACRLHASILVVVCGNFLNNATVLEWKQGSQDRELDTNLDYVRK